MRGSRRATAGLIVLLSLAVANDPAWSQVGPVPVQLTAVASAGTGGGEFYDTATLSGGSDPTGTVTFRLFGPGDDTCSGPPVFTSVRPVEGAGTAPVTVTSDPVSLSEPGVYRFVASYSGDGRHAPAGPTDCLDPGQAVGFGSSSIAFTAEASPAATVGGSIWDTATVASGSVPTGTIVFRLFGPDAGGCGGSPVFTSVTAVNGSGTYRSGGYTPLRPGAYRWVAAYSGDADDPSAESSCGDPRQQVRVAPAAAVPAYHCAALAQQRHAVDGRLRSLQQTLAARLEPASAALLHDAVSSTVRSRFDDAALGLACG